MTVWNLLIALNLQYAHVSIRCKAPDGLKYLGGGDVASVLRRFGDYKVEKSYITDNVLILFVR